MRKIALIFVILLFFASSVFAQQSAYDKALDAYAKKEFKTAIEYLKEYTSEKPEAKAYYLLGYASYKLKNFKEAADYFSEAYLIDPEFDPTTIFDQGAKAKKETDMIKAEQKAEQKTTDEKKSEEQPSEQPAPQEQQEQSKEPVKHETPTGR